MAVLEQELDSCLEGVHAAVSGTDAVIASVPRCVQFYAHDPASARVMFGHPHAMGVRGTITEAQVHPMINKLFDANAQRIEADRASGRIARDVHPRRIAVLARMLATGIAWTWALLPRVGTTSRHGLDDLLADAEHTLRRALAPTPRTRTRARN